LYLHSTAAAAAAVLCLGEFSSAGHMTDKGGGFLAYSGCAVEIWWRFQACQSQKGLWIKRALKKKQWRAFFQFLPHSTCSSTRRNGLFIFRPFRLGPLPLLD